MKKKKMDTLNTVAEIFIFAGLMALAGLVGTLLLDRRKARRAAKQELAARQLKHALLRGVQDAVRTAMDAHAEYWYGEKSDDGGHDKRNSVPE